MSEAHRTDWAVLSDDGRTYEVAGKAQDVAFREAALLHKDEPGARVVERRICSWAALRPLHERDASPVSETPGPSLGAAQAIHEAHTTMRYSLADIANGDTGSLDPADCPICTPPASVTPGPGEDDLRGEVERLARAVDALCVACRGRGWTEEHDPDDPHREGCETCPVQVQCNFDQHRIAADIATLATRADAAVEQRTLAEQKVARVEALCQTGVFDVREWGERGTPYSNGAARAFSRIRAALADPEADR